MDPNRDMLNDIFKMTKENNQMLHGMRRRALMGGVIKIIFIIVAVAAPIWFYMTYLNSTVQQVLETVQKMQDAGTTAQAQLSSFETIWKDLQSKLPSFLVGSSTKQ